MFVEGAPRRAVAGPGAAVFAYFSAAASGRAGRKDRAQMSRLLGRQRIKPAQPVLLLVAMVTLFLVAAPPAFARTWKSSDGA